MTHRQNKIDLENSQATFLSRNAASHLCSDVRLVGVSLECLATVNSLLDEILARILAHSQSFSLALLRRATLDVMGVSFGQNAITEAEMKLQVSYPLGSYYNGKHNQKLKNFPLDAAFNTLRYNAILKSKYSDPGLQSLTLAANLETKLYESLNDNVLDLGSIPTAAIFVSGVMECVAEAVCLDLAAVVVRSSIKSEASLYDLYDAIQENDRLNSLIQGMLIKDEIEHKVKQAEERRRSVTSEISRISRISQQAPPKSRPPPIDTAHSNTIHRRSSSIGARLFSGLHTPVSAASTESIGRRSSSYLRKFKNTPEFSGSYESQHTGFDSVLNNKQTLRLSLTPNTVDTSTASSTHNMNSHANTLDEHDELGELGEFDEVDSLDEELGLGARKPNKKESLIDFLNSTPPWERNQPERSASSKIASHSTHSLPSSVEEEHPPRTAGISDFSRDLIAFLNTEPPGGTPKPLNQKKSTNKFKSIFKAATASTLSSKQSTGHSHHTSSGSILNTAASTNGLGSVSSKGSASYGAAPKSSSSTLRNLETDRQSVEQAVSSPPPKVIPPPNLTNAYTSQPQPAEKLPPIQSPLPMSTSFTRSPSPQLSASPVSYIHTQQSPKMSQSQSQHSPHTITQSIPSSSSAIADQYAAAVLRRTQSSQNNLNLSPNLPSLTRSSSPSEDVHSAPLPRSRSQSIRRADGKLSTPRKPVPALKDVDGGTDEKKKKIEKHDKHHTYQSIQSSSEWSEKEKHNSTSTNGRYSTAVQTISRPSTLGSGGDAYIHKDRLVKMHKILQNAQTADECKLYLDAFLKSNKIPMSIPSMSTSSASMKPQSRSSGGVDEAVEQRERDSQQSHYSEAREDREGVISGIPMSISEDRQEEEEEHGKEGESDSKQFSPNNASAVEIDHASSHSSLPQLVEQDTSDDIQVDYAPMHQPNLAHAQSPTEISTPIGTPITPTAATPYPAFSKAGQNRGLHEQEDDFVTKWLMSDSQAHTGNGIQVEISDAA